MDESKKVDQSRQDRLQDMTKERPRPVRPQETEFDKLLDRSRMAGQLGPQAQSQSKTLGEEAVREATRHQDQGQERRRDDEDRRDGQDNRQRGDRSEGKTVEGKVIAKGKLKQDSGGAGGGSREGFGAATGRRSLSRDLSRAGARSLPIDLHSKFAGRLSKAMEQSQTHQAGLTQQVLNKIVQFVRIGLNRKGQKEIQLELSERIFRGLKLRVVDHEGKVGVYFQTRDPRGKKIFEENADAIRDALAKKGIEVDEIVIN